MSAVAACSRLLPLRAANPDLARRLFLKKPKKMSADLFRNDREGVKISFVLTYEYRQRCCESVVRGRRRVLGGRKR
jgi:hypothetical protein